MGGGGGGWGAGGGGGAGPGPGGGGGGWGERRQGWFGRCAYRFIMPALDLSGLRERERERGRDGEKVERLKHIE